MIDKKFKAVFWDFGGVITSSPFQAFSSFENENDLPKDFIRRVNSTNPYENAWAKLESSKISLEEFDKLFALESENLGFKIEGSKILELLQGSVVPGFTFLACIVIIFSGTQLLALGIIGEYLARIHLRSMGRPPYLIRETL